MLPTGILRAYWGRAVVELIPVSAFLLTALALALFALTLRCPNWGRSFSAYASKGGLFSSQNPWPEEELGSPSKHLTFTNTRTPAT